VELLVVLTIIALASAAIVLAVPDPRGNLASEAERFAARARAAQERAIMDNRAIGLRVSPSGYAFEWRQSGQWQPIGQKPFLPQRWSDGVQANVSAADARIVFDTTGLADPLHVALTRGREQVSVDIANGGTIRVVR
jgi:general secretion pathway protein H